MNDLAKRIRDWRKELDLTLFEAGKRIDIPPSTLHRWETGESEPTGLYHKKILRVLENHKRKVSDA